MKPVLSAASSDLERAQSLSRALSRPAVPLPRPVAKSQSYTRLPAITPTSREARALPALEAGTRWPGLVSWAQQATQARAAFAVDAKGLLVGAVAIEDEEATRIGGRLALAFDQCAQIDHVRAMSIDWAGETMTMLEVRDGDDVPVLLGILGHPEPLPIQALVSAARAALTQP